MEDDVVALDVASTTPTSRNLGPGDDQVNVSDSSGTTRQVRITFTSAEVGNDRANDGNSLANQDGGPAVRVQAENADGVATGTVSRFDDEGIRFVSTGNFTFDVRDLVSGVARGSAFSVVQLGTVAADTYNVSTRTAAYYVNAGMGNDSVITGSGNDFLVGGGGDDTLVGGAGDDSFIGGLGSDSIQGGDGNDSATFNITTDGTDRFRMGAGDDTVTVTAAANIKQVRVTFTSSEVGNGSDLDSNSLPNQTGQVAVSLRAEGRNDNPRGTTARTDDEGITLVASGAFTFDVRDLTTEVQRGDRFNVVKLGSMAADTFDGSEETRNYYVNAGMGNDTITTGSGDDFLVGGAGDDFLRGGLGNDTFLGGGGADFIVGNAGDDIAIWNASFDGADTTNLQVGDDLVRVFATNGERQVRVTFTSAEVGNDNVFDAGTGANQDGGLAVRIQTEGADGNLAGTVGRFDDEGITFVVSRGVTFDVRDLVSGTARGDQFDVISLGTSRNDFLRFSGAEENYYVNAGAGNDRVIGGVNADFLVGGAGDDILDGRRGDDSMIGGGGADTFVFVGVADDDRILDFVSGTDKIDFSGYGISSSDVTSAASGSDTVLSVDRNSDGTVDFTVTLVGVSTAPVATDYIF